MWTWIILCTRISLSALKEKGGLEDYENYSAAQAVQTPNPLNVDAAETSEDEEEICYTRVNIRVTPGCQQSFGTSDGEKTEYSEVQFWVKEERVLKVDLWLCCIIYYILFTNMCEQIIKLHSCKIYESSLAKSAAYVAKILCCVLCHFSPKRTNTVEVWEAIFIKMI